ncbi:MAG: cysteine desulfurase-like protein [Gemmataceae bacterium]
MIEVATLRRQFPALLQRRDEQMPIFLDGPAGTQVPQRTMDAISHYLSSCNANKGGAFATSVESDRILQEAHEAMADFVNAPSSKEIVFGPNMTTLTFQISRSLAKTWEANDEILVSRLDHDANVTPWVMAAEDKGVTVRRIDFRPEDCTLDMDDFKRKLNDRTKLVAVTCASNLTGSKPNVKAITKMAHDAGALVYLDAVHYAPHGLIDVQDWDCDFLVCSAYKFFGPHIGILWGKEALLEELPAYQLRPAPQTGPGKWMIGTQNHECIAGVTATIDYITELSQWAQTIGMLESRREQLVQAMWVVQTYETNLGVQLLHGLSERPDFKVWGITNLENIDQRVPTISVTHAKHSPKMMAEHLARRYIYAWSGNNYALTVTERLDLEDKGGVLRLGLVHYNTQQEVERVLSALDELP